jgi:hypothetical protein
MVVIKIFGATVAQQASFSADASDWAPKPGKGVEAFGQHAGRGGASVGTRFWRPGRARSCGYCGTWGHPSADSSRRRGRGHRSRGRVIRGLCACPLVRASKPMVLDARPDRCAGVRHSVTAHASGRLRDFQGQAPEFKGLWRTPWRCHRSGSCFGWPSGQAGRPGRAVLGGANPRLGAEDIPENARRGPALRWKAVDHLRLLRVLIGVL